LRRTLLVLFTALALVWSLPASAQKQSRKDKKAEKQSKKEAAKDTGSAAAPDKLLYERAMKDIKKGRHEVGRLTLQTLINTYPDSEYLAKAKLAIADSYYKEGGTANLTQAIAAYKDFIVFFPFLPEAPYAQMQVAMTHYKQMEKPDRDRTEALAAEDEFQTYLQKYPNDPLVPQAEQRLREVQEILAEGEYRVGYFYYVKGDRRAAAGRLIPLTKRYPLYSRSDKALWMLGDIFEQSEKKEIASLYYAQIVREYPLSPLAGDAKEKLVSFGVPVPQPDPKALAWMQAEQSAPRPHPGFLSKPLALVQSRPKKELAAAARTGEPNLQPDTETFSATDILTGGGQSRIGSGGGSSSTTGNQAIVEVATPGTGAGGGSTVEKTDANPASATPGTLPATDPNNNSGAEMGSDVAPAPSGADSSSPAGDPKPQTDGNQPPASANGAQNANGDKKKNDKNQKESSSKKKKGLRKIIPW
jgi:outer membrane protein assembly factor BamD